MQPKLLKSSLFLLFLFIVLSLSYHQIVRGNYYHDRSLKNCIRILSVNGKRGNILDRNQNTLAKDQISFDLCISPTELKEKEFVFKTLAQILKTDDKKLELLYKSRRTHPFYPVIIARDLDVKTLITIEEKRIFLPGVSIERNYKRIYPYQNEFCHITGYLGVIDKQNLIRLKDYGYKVRDMIGYSGVEEYFDIELRAEEGGNLIEVDSQGRIRRVLGFKEPIDGKDIELTIDSELQKICYEVLKDQKGIIIFMDPNNGEILALVSHPDFDPNIFVDEKNTKERDRLLNDKKNSPFLNRAIYGLYPLGSVFKLVVVAAALEENLIFPQKRFFCKGQLLIGDRNFRCWDKHSGENLIEAIVHSCNSYFFQLGLFIGPKPILKYALKLGLGRKTGIEFVSESKGFVPSLILKRWFLGDIANLSIGQGELLATPLQALSLISIFANGGKLVIPHILKSVYRQTTKNYSLQSVVLGDKTVSVIREALLKSVECPSGTAHRLKMKTISVAGKTGTAQVSGRKAHGWFVGFSPFKEPKYSFCILLENCGSSQYAVAKTKEILKKMKERGLL